MDLMVTHLYLTPDPTFKVQSTFMYIQWVASFASYGYIKHVH